MEFINTKNAPAAIGPYSQAVKVNNMLFVSGQIPINPQTGELVLTNIEDETKLVLNNLKNIIEHAGFSLNEVAKVTVFIKDMNNFAKINAIYEEFFGSHKPARAVVEVARLPKDVDIEVEAVCVKD
ncbi:RidA family protein [Deferribacterales bacterium Es71-Z0220]|jgi:2-iminobutanoate/2-iminopropanoate deaminase|uniref:RidA family protein n=1 Tax=Deferrivibrio essentukiensis TaxID=2880922 RepID=UPI001F6253B8|nr:RidA family protein [Deferrivibrio essentukiensis]MBZ4672159.1 translation initiation inhibitor [Deferribacteraceae bacterium]MCB4204942.1 RidA family protein [Deferrivibrio essentukiensis]